MRAALAVLLCLLPPLAAAGSFYKCTVGGRTVYQAEPCAPGAGGTVELVPINSLGGAPQRKGEQLPPAPPGAAGPLPVGPGWHAGAAGFDAAQAESRRDGRPMLIYFYTDWCPYCRAFDQKVLTDAAVGERLAKYVKVRINPEHGMPEDSLHKLYGGRGIPHVMVQGADGKAFRVRGTDKAKSFATALDEALAALASGRR